jgi:mRNA interferase RelE/StbE
LSAYQVEISRQARRDLDKAPAHVRARARAAIDRLAVDPRPPGSLKLKGKERTWRVRVGEWRVLYEIHDEKLFVLVVRVPPRGSAY